MAKTAAAKEETLQVTLIKPANVQDPLDPKARKHEPAGTVCTLPLGEAQGLLRRNMAVKGDKRADILQANIAKQEASTDEKTKAAAGTAG